MREPLLIVLLACAAGGCGHTSRSVVTLVRDIQVDGPRLAIESCAVMLTVTQHNLADQMLDPGPENRDRYSVSGACGVEREALPHGLLPPEVAETRAARRAARAGDCGAVRDAAARVQATAPSYYATTFVRDASIGRCLGGPP